MYQFYKRVNYLIMFLTEESLSIYIFVPNTLLNIIKLKYNMLYNYNVYINIC